MPDESLAPEGNKDWRTRLNHFAGRMINAVFITKTGRTVVRLLILIFIYSSIKSYVLEDSYFALFGALVATLAFNSLSRFDFELDSIERDTQITDLVQSVIEYVKGEEPNKKG